MSEEDTFTNSRLIVKNLPKHLTNERLHKHFTNDGEWAVTDAKICFHGAKSRMFGFVGFKNEQHAKKALKHFNQTFIDTSKVEVGFAKAQNDPSLPRAWSRHTQGSSAYKLTHKPDEQAPSSKKREDKASQKEIEDKKRRFREFLSVMGVKDKDNKQSWNENFQEYMDKGDRKVQRTKRFIPGEDDGLPEEKKKEKEEKEAAEDKKDEPEEDTLRLYVMNLSYQVTQDELQQEFSKFGELTNIEIPLRKGGKGQALGIAYISFKDTEGAISAFAQLDKTFYQGRKLHILPAQKKPPREEIPWEERKPREDYQTGSEFKKEKEKTMKLNFDDETNWNYLFMNQDTVAASMAKRLGIEKRELLDRDSSNMAVNMAKSEAIIITQTKEWMVD